MASTASFLARRSGKAPRYMSEINVTPFVDVMLVLLVIFMIAAPMMTTGIKVDLPEARTAQLASDTEPVEISIDAEGRISLGDARVAQGDFQETLVQMAQAAGDPAQMRVFVRADRSLDYGFVMTVVSRIASAGFTKVAFLSDPKGEGSRDRDIP